MLTPTKDAEEHVWALMIWSTVGLICLGFLWILGELLWHGWTQLSWNFLFTAPQNSGRDGGIGPILISTSLIIGVCIIVAWPIDSARQFFLLNTHRIIIVLAASYAVH